MKIFALTIFVFLSACSGQSFSSVNNSRHESFAGNWSLNNPNDDLSGEMKIWNCTASQCEFKLNSGQYANECEANGVMKISDENKASYYFKYYDAGITFTLLPDKAMSVSYSNTHSRNIFCGMNATLEGSWKIN